MKYFFPKFAFENVGASYSSEHLVYPVSLCYWAAYKDTIAIPCIVDSHDFQGF
jgi:hypothetical protein